MTIYTDGAYSQSRQRGGYAFIVYENGEFTKKYYKGIDNATNQRTEMLAVISAFRYLLAMDDIPKTMIVTDSMYVVGTCTQGWKVGANHDLWEIVFVLLDQLKDKISFKHVRGHVGIEGNELADMFSVIASEGIENGKESNN